MNRTKLYLAMSAGISALLVSQAHASGFQLVEHSASGLGRAFAGEAAIADNASVIARNPAAMSRFETAAVSGALSYVDANVEISGDSNSALDQDDIVPNAFVPAAYYIQPINDRWAVGFGIYSNFGLSTEFDDDYYAGEMGGTTELSTLNFNPSLSLKVNDTLSLGAGVSAVYGEAKLVRNYGAILSSVYMADRDSVSAGLEGTSWGYGWNAGALIELNSANRFGIRYQSKVDIDFEGTFTSDLTAYSALDGETGNLVLNLPDIFEFSGYHELSDSFAIHYSAMWTGWSYFEELSATVGSTEVLQKDENFNDAWRYSIGATYDATPSLVLRVGFGYDEAASTTDQSISIPDSDRWVYSAGMTYQFSESLSVDLGAMLIDGEEVSFTESNSTGAYSYDFSSEGQVLVTSVGINYLF
jgi:long-chain fatty acid transport protein